MGQWQNYIDLGFPKELLSILVVWAVVWKGLALWRAARNDSRYWFIALLVINTLGVLEILYLFLFSKPKTKEDVFAKKLK